MQHQILFIQAFVAVADAIPIRISAVQLSVLDMVWAEYREFHVLELQSDHVDLCFAVT